jgi:hypothetical protein
MPYVMAGIAAVGAISGAVAGRSTQYRTQRKRINNLFSQLYNLQAVAADKAGAELRQTLENFQQSVKDARAENSNIYGQAKRDAISRGKQLGAKVNQGLISSGLSGTTMSGNAERGVTADTSRMLGQLSAQEAGRNQELIMAGAQGSAQLQTMLANLYQQQGQNRVGLGLQHGDMLFSKSAQRGPSPAAAGMQSFGSFLPFLLGGMGGGPSGSQAIAGWDPTAYRG